MFGADREPPKAQLVQMLAHCAFVELDPKSDLNPARKIGAPPAHYTVAHGVRACLDPSRKLRHLLGCEPGLYPTTTPIGQPVNAFGVVAVYPITQRLPVHATVLRSRLARCAVQDQSNSQKPPRHLAIPHVPCRHA